MPLLNVEIALSLVTAFLAGLAIVLATGVGRARREGQVLSALGLVAAVCALAGLGYRCVASGGPAIQRRLQSDALETVHAASFSGVQVLADGRDLELSGSLSSEDRRIQAGDVALGVGGVRRVDNRISVIPAAAPAPPPPSVSVQERLDQILSNRRIEFETGRDVLSASSIPGLEEVLSLLKEVSQVAVRVEGHTDNAGDA